MRVISWRPLALFVMACVLLATSFLLGSCSKDKSDSDDPSTSARMEVRMTDAPGNYDAVNVDVQAVQIHVSDVDEEENWQSLNLLHPGVINLLDLANGNDVLLASADFPEGRISQIRLKLGTNNTVKLHGDPTLYELKTPSAQQSGLKLKINADLRKDVTYRVMLDFDAGKSVVERGNGQDRFSLKPVIRTITTAIAGGVRGKVEPVQEFASSALLISAAHDTVSTGISPTTGAFLFRGIVGGTYSLHIPGVGLRTGQTNTQTVTVATDQIKDVGTVRF